MRISLETQHIKAEAARRIDEIAPLWRQQNDNALMLRLAGSPPDRWSDADRLAHDAAAARRAAIDRIRAASNRLEQLDPIPLDYRADKHWT
ncbi:MAG: hypothetical protein KDJ19_00750 [Hyphomicrobiaceae bacterium]|nr:hypothetical protein [Hyphomicrobiaceae bacterium]MCC0024637.1 hypothetical protein [Hyphomicrobiaceae bacterium]